MFLLLSLWHVRRRKCCELKPRLHQQQCRSNVRLCCQKRQQCRTSFALKFRPFDKVERCFDTVASVDRALVRPATVASLSQRASILVYDTMGVARVRLRQQLRLNVIVNCGPRLL